MLLPINAMLTCGLTVGSVMSAVKPSNPTAVTMAAEVAHGGNCIVDRPIIVDWLID
jgi:hypothetical protein